MDVTLGRPAPPIAADAYVRGERRRCMEVDEFRNAWVVVALGARTIDLHDLAELEEAFAADGAVVVAATPDDYHDVEARLAHEPSIRFPVLTDVDEPRRLTLILDPEGVVRYAGLGRTARETLDVLEALVGVTAPLHLAA
jgi:alkyl hydroperoxide reductase subunit AhpC